MICKVTNYNAITNYRPGYVIKFFCSNATIAFFFEKKFYPKKVIVFEFYYSTVSLFKF